MAYDFRAARVGDEIILEEPGRPPLRLTVWSISSPDADLRAHSAGPRISAWIRPGGYGISFDAHSHQAAHVRAV